MVAITNMEKQKETVPKPKGFFGVRHIQMVLLFIIVFINYGMRTNMSVGIIAMMKETPPYPGIPTFPDWTLKQTIISSFFWGYVIPQIGAGQLVKLFGPKWFLAVTTVINSFFCILIPIMAEEVGESGVIVCRVIQGLTQGFLFPSVHNLLGKWAPLAERSTLASFVYTGGPLGTVVSLPVTGLISDSQVGWPAVFYLYGGIGLGWVVFWVIFASNSPAEHKFITKEEREFIEGGTLEESKTEIPTPWWEMFTSLPVWAVLVAHCGQSWGFWTLLGEIPTYMDQILHFDMESNSLLSALPYFVLWVLSLIFSPIADYLITRRYCSIGLTRKIFQTIGTVIPASALISLSFVKDDSVLAITLLVIAVGVNAGVYSGFNVNHIDLSPNHAGTLMGITNSISNIFSIVAPYCVDGIPKEENDPELWEIVFLIAAGIYVVSDVFFVVFASGELQPWNEPDKKSSEDTKV